MKRKTITANGIIESIKNDMVIVENVELCYKNVNRIENLESSKFISDLESLSKTDIFSKSIDFEYEYIYDGKSVSNDKLKIVCNYENCYAPYYITAILKLNGKCNLLEDLIQILSETYCI